MDSLRELTDHNEIQSLIIRTGAMLDDHDFPGATEIFTDDVAINTPGGTANGVEAAIAQATRNHAKFTTQHLISNVMVELDGDSATARASVAATFLSKHDPTAPRKSVAGSYSYVLRRTADGWRIAELGMKPLWNDLHAAV